MTGRPRTLDALALGAMAIALAATPLYVVRFRVGIPTTLLEVVLLVAIALGLWAHRNHLPWRNPYALAALVFLAGATLSVFAAPDRRAALGIWKAYFIEPALAALVIAAMVRRRRDARVLLAGLGVAGTLVALAQIAIVARAGLTGHFHVEHPPVAIYTTPNAVALFLVPLEAFSIPIALYGPERLDRVLAAAFTAVASIAVLLSYSRAGWLALLAVAVFAALFHPARLRVVAAIAVGGVVALVVPSIRRRVEIELDPHNPNNSIGLRLSLWKSALNMLRHHPIFGGGLSGFQKSVEPYRDPGYREHLIYPHNLVLNFWSETGLVGLAGFILLGVCALRAALRGLSGDAWTRVLSIGVLALLVAFAVHGLADVPYFKNDQAVAFWALVAVQLGALQNHELTAEGRRRGPATSAAPQPAS